jgi:hypothetical protein
MKPSDFSIGVIDFFSVILPGALLTFFLKGMFYGTLFGEGKLFPEPQEGIAESAVFLMVAYIVGNLIFMLASRLDASYDKHIRKRLFQPKHDVTYKVASQLREKFIETDVRLRELVVVDKLTEPDCQTILKNPNRHILNTFKWAQHFLLFNKPEALAEIERTIADSKFFRSLVICFLIMAVVLLVGKKTLFPGIFVALAVLCYYRYGELRFKATLKAYELIITFFYQKPKTVVDEVDSGTKPRSVAHLKTDLPADFSDHHRSTILFLAKGSVKPPKRIAIAPALRSDQRFISEQNEWWYCLEGRGCLQTVAGGKTVKTILLPRAIVPIVKGSEFSLSNEGKQPIELLSFEH